MDGLPSNEKVQETSDIAATPKVERSWILVPLDGSPLSESILPYAVKMAHLTSSGIMLVRATQTGTMLWPVLGVQTTADVIEEICEAGIDQADGYLGEIAERVRAEGLRAATRVVDGDPATSIIWLADQVPCVNMIAMATHGRGGLNRLIFGSVAERVLHDVSKPLLLLRPDTKHDVHKPEPDQPAEMPAGREHLFNKILVPLDGSHFAEQALVEAHELAVRAGARLVLVTSVAEADVTLMVAGAAIIPPDVPGWEQNVESIQAYLEKTAQRLHARTPEIEVETRMVHGSPAQGILRECQDVHADLVVMATHGRSGIARMWLGSVAVGVVQHATVPVLLIRAREQPVRVAEPERVQGVMA